MKSLLNNSILWYTIGGVLLIWFVLTLIVQREGRAKVQTIGEIGLNQNALIVYNPDVFYNLDEQICIALAKGFYKERWTVKVATVSVAKDLKEENFDLYVFCANTYNWAPDRPTFNYIKNHTGLKNKPVIAVTLGSGSTQRAERLLQKTIKSKEANLLLSKAFWLMKPNNESISEMTNTEVAIKKAFQLGQEISKTIDDKKGKI